MIGQYGLYKASSNISNTLGRDSHFLSINHMSSDGYIKNTDFTNNNLFYQAEYRHKSGIFNNSYYDFGGVIQPGIWLMGGIVVDLDYKK
jgi:hypothetical protein